MAGSKKAKLLSTVKAFLEADGWNFSQAQGKPILTMGFKGDAGSWTCAAHTDEEKEQFTFYSILAANVLGNKRSAAAEFLIRANYGLTLGNFEMDFSDGEVRFKTSIDIEGGTLAPAMIKNMIYTNVLMMDKYLPGLNEVIYSKVSPEKAIAKIEG